jgi:hypothetical protein
LPVGLDRIAADCWRVRRPGKQQDIRLILLFQLSRLLQASAGG